ncbi:MAG: PIN domain-containing protein, partial [Chloroflexota bacterium]
MRARYLADKSALARMPRASVAARLRPLIAAGAVATCGIVELEVLFSAHDARELAAVRAERALAFERVDMTEADFDRAADVLLRLAEIG